MSTRYTAAEDPLAREAIDRHLEILVATIRDQLGNLGVEAIVLRGALAGGEGTVLVDGGRVQFFSDYDLDVYARRPAGRSRLQQLSAALTRQLGAYVQIALERSGTRRVPAMRLQQIDDARRERLLWGHPGAVPPPEPGPAEPAVTEGLLLVFNRAVGTLAAILERSASPLQVWYQAVKLTLAVGDYVLILDGRYTPQLGDKLGLVAAGAAARGLSDLAFERAAEWKLRPHAWACSEAELWELIYHQIRAALAAALTLEGVRCGRPLADWHAHSQHIARQCGALTPVAALGRLGCFRSLLLNWQAWGPPRTLRAWPRYRQRGDCILLQAAFLLLSTARAPEPAAVARSLYLLNLVPSGNLQQDWRRASELLVKVWRAYVL
ncbi:MAG TPA: hypothetical protein PLJ35_16240 [Anaerolineae bacterium]|nr:hypothetical protein [Anaerolineae bacterium]HOR00362.1 hypothetical protein [Anaerolineae bacterium]